MKDLKALMRNMETKNESSDIDIYNMTPSIERSSELEATTTLHAIKILRGADSKFLATVKEEL